VFDFPKYLPEILRESGSLFGVFALIAILIAIIVVFFFRNSETKQKERVFLYTSIFLLALVFSALIAGVSTGFQTGQEIGVTQGSGSASQGNTSQAELSSDMQQSLESYLTSQGLKITAQNKSKVLSDALESYLNENIAAPPLSPSSENSGSEGRGATVQSNASTTGSAPDGFIFEGKSCTQRDRTIQCDGLITNTKEDIAVFLFADGYSSDSRIVDSEGNQYIANEIVIGSKTDDEYQPVTFTQNIPVKITLVFQEVSSTAKNVALMEVLGSTTTNSAKADFSFQARNVPVSN
jgi:hypothetical protein